MSHMIDRVTSRTDRWVAKLFSRMPFEQRWDRKGDAPRFERWRMRRPLATALLVAGVPLVALVGLEWVVRPLTGQGEPSWLPLLPLLLLPVLVPVDWSLQRHLATRYQAWQQRRRDEQAGAAET